jgi:hypothetical protein
VSLVRAQVEEPNTKKPLHHCNGFFITRALLQTA